MKAISITLSLFITFVFYGISKDLMGFESMKMAVEFNNGIIDTKEIIEINYDSKNDEFIIRCKEYDLVFTSKCFKEAFVPLLNTNIKYYKQHKDEILENAFTTAGGNERDYSIIDKSTNIRNYLSSIKGSFGKDLRIHITKTVTLIIPQKECVERYEELTKALENRK